CPAPGALTHRAPRRKRGASADRPLPLPAHKRRPTRIYTSRPLRPRVHGPSHAESRVDGPFARAGGPRRGNWRVNWVNNAHSCPIPGRKLAEGRAINDTVDPTAMNDYDAHDLVRYVAASSGLPEATARRVVADVTAYFRETVDEFVKRRHAEL